jgi:predicted  nucleic acid-binding Zn-ribbon protein
MQAAASNTAARHDGLLKTLQAEIVGLTGLRDELRGREATLRGSLQESRGTADDLRRKLAECEAERARMDGEDVEKDAEIRDLRAQLAGLERISELEGALTDIELKLKACTQTRDALERSHAAYVEQLKKNAGAKDLTIEGLRSEMEELRASATRDLAARNADYGAKLSEEQKKQISEYGASIAEMEAAMKNEIDAERQKAIAAGQKQKETITRLNERIAELEGSRAGDIEKEVAEKERRIVALTDRIKELQDQLESKSERNESDAVKTVREDFAKERGELSREITQLRERLAEAETANAELQKRVDDCTAVPAVPAVPTDVSTSVPVADTNVAAVGEAFKKIDDSKYRVDLQADHLIYNINARVWIGDGLRKIFQKDRLTATNSVVPENARMAAFAILSEFLTRTPDIRVLERNNALLFAYPELKDIPIMVDGVQRVVNANAPTDTIFASIGLLTYILERARAPEWRAPYTAAAPTPVPVRPPVVSNVRGSATGRIALAPRVTNATRKRYGRGSGAVGTATLPPPAAAVKKSSRKTRKHRR